MDLKIEGYSKSFSRLGMIFSNFADGERRGLKCRRQPEHIRNTFKYKKLFIIILGTSK